MRKCLQCRKLSNELDSTWDRIRMWLFNRFHSDILDLSQDKYTQGFGDGYKTGYAHAKDQNVASKEGSHGTYVLGGPNKSYSWQENREQDLRSFPRKPEDDETGG